MMGTFIQLVQQTPRAVKVDNKLTVDAMKEGLSKVNIDLVYYGPLAKGA